MRSLVTAEQQVANSCGYDVQGALAIVGASPLLVPRQFFQLLAPVYKSHFYTPTTGIYYTAFTTTITTFLSLLSLCLYTIYTGLITTTTSLNNIIIIGE